MSISEQITQLKQDFDDVKRAGYDEGYEDGISQGGDTEQAYNQGVEAEKKRFMELHQDEGQRIDYTCAFAGWKTENFYPTRSMTPTSAYMMFRSMKGTLIDLVERLAQCGVELKTSQCTNFQNMFMGAFIKRIGEIDITSVTSATMLSSMFGSGAIVTIDKFKVKDDGSQDIGTALNGMSYLRNITIEGKLGKSFQIKDSSKLTTGAEGEFMPDGVTPSNSVQSIIDALMTITDEVPRTIQFHQAVRDKLTPTQEDTIVNVKKWTLLPARTVTAE